MASIHSAPAREGVFEVGQIVKYDGQIWVVEAAYKEIVDLICISGNTAQVHPKAISHYVQDATKPRLVVINMDAHASRLSFFLEQFLPYFQIDRKKPVEAPTVQLSLSKTYIEILKAEQAAGNRTVLVLEDDCRPIADDMQAWMSRWLEIKSYLDNSLFFWDYFSGGIICDANTCQSGVLCENPLIKRYNSGWCMHFNYFNIDRNLKSFAQLGDFPEKQHMDVWMYQLHGVRPVAAIPFLAEQQPNYSLTHKMYVDYRQRQRQAEELLSQII
jgi:hypothetical protein